MQPTSSGGVGVSLIYLLFLLLPGFIFVKSSSAARRTVEDLNRTDKLGYILTGGVASLFILILFYGTVTGQKVTISKFQSMDITKLLVGVLFQTAIAALLGLVIGSAQYNWLDNDQIRTLDDRKQPWDRTASKIRQADVTVVTENGHEIEGTVFRYGSGSKSGNLTLQSPKRVVRREGKRVGEFRLGNEEFNELYVSEKSIGQIYYRDDDYLPDDDFLEEELENIDTEQQGPDEDNDGKWVSGGIMPYYLK